MTPLLTLARDYLERMSNPALGVAMNESYALKFGALLLEDKLQWQLADEIKQLRDPQTLTSHGWLWLLDVIPSWGWFLLKSFAFLYLFIWVRATLPRYRYDQLMRLGWKVLIPLAIANLIVTGIVKVALLY